MDTAGGPRKVAVLGLEGSGKTVLLATLAKRFGQAGHDVLHLVPGRDTAKYCDETWATLQSGHWPRPTFTNEILHYSWTVRRPKRFPFDLMAADVSGRALRQIFGPGTARDTPLPSHLALIRHIYRQADRLLLLVNIGDFVGQRDADQRRDNLSTLLNAVRRLNPERTKKTAIAITQFDRYQPLIAKYGGLDAFLDREVGSIHIELLHGRPVDTLPVSAVHDTRTVFDENGDVMATPSPGFRSDGLNRLMEWLTAGEPEVRAEPAPLRQWRWFRQRLKGW